MPTITDQKLFRASLPYTITTMLAHMGGFTFRGAPVRLGVDRRNVTFRHPDYGFEEEVRGEQPYWAIEGYLHYTVGIDLPVNGKRSEGWRMIVSLDGNDLYSVWLIASDYKGQGRPHMLEAASSVYAEDLIVVMDDIHTRAIEEYCDGFIPLD
jgi:hypothetical protein